MVAASKCRLLDADAVGTTPSAGLGTLATAAVGSTSWRASVAVGTDAWSAGDAVWNASMDTTVATTTTTTISMIHRFIHF
jgi:hypothetical protein